MGQLKALDLFCGGGGASMGLHRAGYDVTGVDVNPQPRYPFRFIQGDATTFPLDGFDFIWASPPCQAFSRLRHLHKKERPNLIPITRSRLEKSGIPYCIENVEDAPLGDSGFLIMLCGTMFGLRTKDGRAELRRHRLFETSFSIPLRPRCQHGYVRPRSITITGSTPQTNTVRNVVRETFTVDQAREAMGIDWMSMKTLSQAIPPAYSEFIARQLLQQAA